MSTTQAVSTEQPVASRLNVARQLDDLRTLADGWLNGEGFAPPAAGLDWLAAAFADHFPDRLPLPRLYPTVEGGVQAEWKLGEHDVSLTIDLVAKSAYWHDLDLASDQDEDNDLDLSDPKAWAWVAGRLERRGEATP